MTYFSLIQIKSIYFWLKANLMYEITMLIPVRVAADGGGVGVPTRNKEIEFL